jgi:hypothetical protein
MRIDGTTISVDIDLVVFLRHRVEPLICPIVGKWELEHAPKNVEVIVENVHRLIQNEIRDKGTYTIALEDKHHTLRSIKSDEIQAYYVVPPHDYRNPNGDDQSNSSDA